jgi:hypothetical protein
MAVNAQDYHYYKRNILMKINFVFHLCNCLYGFITQTLSVDKIHCWLILFRATGFFSEADTLESTSILIYLESKTGLNTQMFWQEAALIKRLLIVKS